MNIATRRRLLAGGLAGFACTLAPYSRAEALRASARMTEGPFYPRELPLDRDNDLLRYAGAEGVPDGVPLDLRGRVLDTSGRALAGVRVEIWQCDAHGRYHHVEDPGNDAKLDLPFQGYGECTSGADGGYRFRTIKPVPYSFRTAHIHFKLSGTGFRDFSTQMFVAGEARNARDGIYNGIREERDREALTVRLAAAADGGLAGNFDLVLAADGRSAHLA